MLGVFLLEFGINYYSLFVPDLLHKFDLGVWKAVWGHLMCLLDYYRGDLLTILNERYAHRVCSLLTHFLTSSPCDTRYRRMPTFGHGTIRPFKGNVSAEKKLAGRDYEDMLLVCSSSYFVLRLSLMFLQCAIPAFDGILPKLHNTVVLDLLFSLVIWQSYAKLKLHSDSTLVSFDNQTTLIGRTLRSFKKKTCDKIDTRKLAQKDSGYRTPRQPDHPSRGAPTGKKGAASRKAAPSSGKKKVFNMNTYKMHALGHYVPSVKRLSTNDNYSTKDVHPPFFLSSPI